MSFIFIVGVGRSGTSLLHSIVGSHTDIYAIPETSFLRRYVFNTKLSNYNKSSDQKLARFSILHNKFLKSSKSQIDNLTVYKSLQYDFPDYKYVLDKDPKLVEYTTLLHKVCNDIKIIILTRDPRDVLVSKKNALWSKGRSLFSYLLASHVQLSDSKNALCNSNTFHLSYESLLLNSSDCIEDICEFLGINYEIGMLNFQDTSKRLVSNDEFSWKKETLHSINRDNINKWSGNISDFESYLSILISESAFPGLGYKQDVNLPLHKLIIANGFKILVMCSSFFYRIFRSFKHPNF